MTTIDETFLVGVDFEDENHGVLIVGKKMPGEGVEIVNAFEGEEAWELYQKLKTVKKKEGENNG